MGSHENITESDYTRGEMAAKRDGSRVIVTVDAEMGGACRIHATYRYVLKSTGPYVFRVVEMDLAGEKAIR